MLRSALRTLSRRSDGDEDALWESVWLDSDAAAFAANGEATGRTAMSSTFPSTAPSIEAGDETDSDEELKELKVRLKLQALEVHARCLPFDDTSDGLPVDDDINESQATTQAPERDVDGGPSRPLEEAATAPEVEPVGSRPKADLEPRPSVPAVLGEHCGYGVDNGYGGVRERGVSTPYNVVAPRDPYDAYRERLVSAAPADLEPRGTRAEKFRQLLSEPSVDLAALRKLRHECVHAPRRAAPHHTHAAGRGSHPNSDRRLYSYGLLLHI